MGGCKHGYDFVDDDLYPLPSMSSHGTHIAGIIAATKNNGKGIIGAAPQVKVMALKIGEEKTIDVFSEIRAIDFAIANGAKIINASYGGPSFSKAQYDAIQRFQSVGGIYITAAGNNAVNNDQVPLYPCNYDLAHIICVAATNQNDDLASFSDYGVTSVDVGAPGVNILSTVPTVDAMVSETFSSIANFAVPGGWIKGGTTNNWGVLDATSWLGPVWGKVLYGDAFYAPYLSDANSTVSLLNFDLGGSTGGAGVDFWSSCDTADDIDDYMALEVSVGGSYEELGRWNEFFSTLDYDYVQIGVAGVWTQFHFLREIPSQFLTSNFSLQFRWHTDNDDNVSIDGCAVDDVRIIKVSDGSDELYDYFQGTSMAVPHVAGVAALIWSSHPTLSPTELKRVVLETGDKVVALEGKTVSGKRINAYRALQAVACAGLPATLIGTEGDDILTGTSGDDVIIALGGNDTIDGLGGNDLLCAMEGNDVVYGGEGTDKLNGGDGHDKLYGDEGADTLNGALGNDELHGGTEDDKLNAGEGNDIVLGDQGNDILNGSTGADELHGGEGIDTLNAGEGNDKLWGDEGEDILNGSLGDDELHGGAGADTLNAGEGDDVLYGDEDADTLNSSTGNDIANGGDGDDLVRGGEGNDMLHGGNGLDTLQGGSGEDSCMGAEAITGCEEAVALNEILPNPEGLDTQDGLLGEWVELYNNGTAPVDVAGWYLKDAIGNTKVISSSNTHTGSTILGAKGSGQKWLVVFLNDAILNNTGDTVYLYNPVDVLKDSVSFDKGIEGSSIARIPNGIGAWVDSTPTLGTSNLP